MADCPHANYQHRIWYWIDDPHDPVPTPYQATVDNHADAQGAIDRLMAEPAVKWAKAFRHDNEFYTCIKREREPDPQPEEWFSVSEPEPTHWKQTKGSLWQRFKEWLGL